MAPSYLVQYQSCNAAEPAGAFRTCSRAVSAPATRTTRRWSAAMCAAGALIASKYQYMCPWLQRTVRKEDGSQSVMTSR